MRWNRLHGYVVTRREKEKRVRKNRDKRRKFKNRFKKRKLAIRKAIARACAASNGVNMLSNASDKLRKLYVRFKRPRRKSQLLQPTHRRRIQKVARTIVKLLRKPRSLMLSRLSPRERRDWRRFVAGKRFGEHAREPRNAGKVEIESLYRAWKTTRRRPNSFVPVVQRSKWAWKRLLRHCKKDWVLWLVLN